MTSGVWFYCIQYSYLCYHHEALCGVKHIQKISHNNQVFSQDDEVILSTFFVKVVLRPKKSFFFSLDFKTMLTKHYLTHVLSSDFKKTPVYSNWNFLIYWSAITNFKTLRELGGGENDSLV